MLILQIVYFCGVNNTSTGFYTQFIYMQRLINEIVERAKADRQRIVLPEGTEERTLKAANQI